MELALAVQQSIVEDFNRLEAENEKIRDRQGQDAITRINNHRQQGFLLMDYKEGVGHGRFQASFQSSNGKTNVNARFRCDAATGRRYIRIAKRFPDTIADVRTAMYAIVELWNPPSLEGDGHNGEKLHQPNFYSQAVRLKSNLIGQFNHYLQRRPIKVWRTEEVFDLLSDLKPLADMVALLETELQSRNDLPAGYRPQNGN